MAYIGKIPAAAAITASDLAPAVITGQTALAVAPADTDEFLISDAGTLKRLDASLIGGGKVGQVISTQLAVERTTTSADYADITGVAVTITPSATSSKVLVQGSILWGRSTNNTMWLKMYRDSTNINGQSFSSSNTGTFWGSGVDSGYYELRSAPFSFLDSPNTTSAVTYKIQWKSDGNTLYMNRIGADTNQAGTSQINAIEILA